MKSTEELVTELADREAIRELPVRYCDCVWQNTLDAMIDLFAKDGQFITKGRKREVTTKGHADLHKMYAGALGEINPRPYIHNHVVDLKSKTTATGRCYVELRSAKKNFEWIGTGFYDDEYVKVDGKWKFASRKFNSFAMAAAGVRVMAGILEGKVALITGAGSGIGRATSTNLRARGRQARARRRGRGRRQSDARDAQ